MRSSTLLKWVTLSAAACCAGRMLLRKARRYDFHGKAVLITGGSRGLGLLLARQLAEEGAIVVICARDDAELDAARKDVARHGAEVIALRCDVTDRNQVQQLVQEVVSRLGGIDVLINNAGIIQVGPMDEMTLEDFEQAMKVHYWAPLYTTLEALPHMRRCCQGRIVNIASIGGKISVPHLLPYNASKFALVGLSEGLRAELQREGIYVTTVCPGTMRTGSPVHAEFKGQREAEFTWFTVGASLPVASISGERAAREIIEACRYGEAEVILSLPAKAAALLHGVAPGLTSEILAVANRLLPRPGGIGAAPARGLESRPSWLPGWVTTLTDQAARRNNELPARAR